MTLQVEQENITIRRWLNAPFDRATGTFKVTREEYEAKMRKVFDFRWPATYWIFGKRFSGKSTLAEILALTYHDHGATIFDIGSARSNEGLAWLLSGIGKVLLVCGDSIDLNDQPDKYDWKHVSEIRTQKDLEVVCANYDVVVSVPGFYANLREMYRSISHIIDLLKWRIEWDRVVVLMAREARQIIASRIIAGAVPDRQAAEEDFVDLNNQANHTGTALIVDSLRPMSITIDVRDIAEYTFIKRIGRMTLPREFYYLLRFVQPRYLRRMPRSDFLLYTDGDDVFWGKNETLPWHIVRGQNLMKRLGIFPSLRLQVSPQAEEALKPMEPPPQEKHKVTQAIHAKIVRLHESGDPVSHRHLGYRDIARTIEEEDGVHIAIGTVFNELKMHREKTCPDFAGLP